MYKKLRSLRRGCALLLTLVLCAGLLQLPALAAEEDCRLGQEGCVCAEDACREDCLVCHPQGENEEDPDAAGASGVTSSSDEVIPPADLEKDPPAAPEEPICTCAAAEGAPHSEDCPLYEVPADEPPASESPVYEAPARIMSASPAPVALAADDSANLQKAIEDGESGYTLQGDVTGSFTIPAGRAFELDLGGYTLHGAGGCAITNRGDLTLKNGTVENEAGYGVANTATLTMVNVTVSSYDCGVTGAAGTLTLDSCAVTVTAPSGGQPYGVYGQSDCTMILNNTTVRSAFVGVYTSQGTTIDVTVTGGAIYGGFCAAINQWGAGAVTVDSCALTSDSGQVVEHNNGTLDLKNGTSLYAGGKLGVIGTGNNRYDPLTNVTMDASVEIDETSKVHTKWTDYVTSVTAADYAEEGDTIRIYTPAGLAWWAKQLMANDKAFAGHTVRIEDDLDMGGYEWKAVTLGAGKVTIDGRGRTIRNLLIPAAEYTYGRGFIHDIADDFTIQNVTFDAATVGVAGSGNIVGVVLGYTVEKGKTVTMENVRVTNSLVQGLGKVGGLVGMGEGCDLILTNCSVEKTTISGAYNCGGLVGLAKGENTVNLTDCTAEATWEPTGNEYACYNGIAEFSNRDNSKVNIPAKGTFYVEKRRQYLGYYAAWGDQYTDYEQYYNIGEEWKEYNNTLLFVGFCHPANLHTHIDLTGTKCVDTEDGVHHRTVCAGCGADLGLPLEKHEFEENLCKKCGAEKYVCKIGETLYTTIQAAVDAVPKNGTATIEMINDSDLPATIPAGKAITLNVPEGITLTKDADGEKKAILTNSGTLILSGDGKLDINNAGYCVTNFGTAELNGCTLTTNTGDYVVWNKGTMEINGGRILKGKHSSWDAVCNGNGAPNAHLTINDCEITESAGGACVGNQGATAIINGGVFRATLPVENGTNGGDESKLTINGGKFIKDPIPNDKDGTINSYNGKAELLITGGDFYSIDTTRPVIQSNATVTVSGGTFFRGDIFNNTYYRDTRCTVSGPGSLYAFNGKDYDGETDAVRWQIGAPAITLNRTAVTLSRDGSASLTPTVTPADALRTVAWSSSDESVATVDANGVVTAHGPGTANITCTVTFQTAQKNADGTAFEAGSNVKTAACAVTVSSGYTLAYSANGTGVTNLPGNQSGAGTVTISAQRPTRGGYTFRGWATSSIGAAVYQPGGSITLTGSVTLYAVWTANSTSGGGGGTGGSGGSGGGRGGDNTVTINDPLVPLAGDLQLNREDHFAYIKGYQDGTVRPNNPLTRAQVATIYYRLLTDLSRDLYFQETNDFTDVPDDFWACKAISTLANAGIINGFQDGTFRPNAYITRAQFAAMTARFEGVIPGLENPFADVSESHWARDDIAYAVFQGWISGEGNFRPQENITRVETMDFINNVLDRHVDEEGILENAVTFTDVPVTDPNYYVVEEATNSHDYSRRTEGQSMENWTELRDDPVWEE